MKKTIYNAMPRIQKMILKLQRYNISLVYKCGKDLLIADALSRAYQDDNESDSSNLDEYDIFMWKCYLTLDLKNSKLQHKMIIYQQC